MRHLYAHLIQNGMIVAIKNVNEENLHILPEEVLRMIQSGDPAWERMVPQPGVKLIKERGVFGYRAKTYPDSDNWGSKPLWSEQDLKDESSL